MVRNPAQRASARGAPVVVSIGLPKQPERAARVWMTIESFLGLRRTPADTPITSETAAAPDVLPSVASVEGNFEFAEVCTVRVKRAFGLGASSRTHKYTPART